MYSFQCKGQNIFCLSDTHGLHRTLEIPLSDIIIHCGDACNFGNQDELQDFLVWFSELPIPKKVFIPGNHDLIFELYPNKAREIVPKNILIPRNKKITVNNVRISGLTIGFQYLDDCEYAENTDILLTHFPPLGTLDNNKGDASLAKFVKEFPPQYHIFGHIHEGRGILRSQNTVSINASLPNLDTLS